MGIVEIAITGVVLSLDAFAVAVCKGLNMTKINYRQAAVIALFFGGFQALMPYIGWLLGSSFQKYIEAYDHWVAFGLLFVIGGKMVYEVLFEKEGEDSTVSEKDPKLNIMELFMLAVATSIDALAVGIAFAMTDDVNIYPCIALIGCITFALSFIGVAVGNIFGSKYEKKAEFIGGVVLILLGVKILLEGYGIL